MPISTPHRLLTILLLVSTSPLIATDHLYTQTPAMVGHAGHQGELALWKDLGQLSFSENQKPLPIKLNFYTKNTFHPDSCIGANWCLPLIESYYKIIDEGACTVYMPGGHRFHLNQHKDGTYRHVTGQWEGRMTSKDGSFHLRNEKLDYALVFKKNKLHELRISDQDLLTWKYNSAGRVSSIKHNGSTLLTATHDSEGYLTLLRYKVDGKPSQCTFQVEVIDSVPHLTKLIAPDLKWNTLDYSQEDGAISNITINGDETEYRWNPETGEITYAEGHNYEVEWVENQYRPKVTILKDGEISESYNYNESKGIAVYRDGDKILTRHYITSPGANHMKKRKVTIKNEQGDYIKSWEIYYDLQGRKIRNIYQRGQQDPVITHHFYNNTPDSLQSFKNEIHLADDKIIRILYNENGSVIETNLF